MPFVTTFGSEDILKIIRTFSIYWLIELNLNEELSEISIVPWLEYILYIPNFRAIS